MCPNAGSQGQRYTAGPAQQPMPQLNYGAYSGQGLPPPPLPGAFVPQPPPVGYAPQQHHDQQNPMGYVPQPQTYASDQPVYAEAHYAQPAVPTAAVVMSKSGEAVASAASGVYTPSGGMNPDYVASARSGV